MSDGLPRKEPQPTYATIKYNMAKRITATIESYAEKPMNEWPAFRYLVAACAREYGVSRKQVEDCFDNCFPDMRVNMDDRIVMR